MYIFTKIVIEYIQNLSTSNGGSFHGPFQFDIHKQLQVQGFFYASDEKPPK